MKRTKSNPDVFDNNPMMAHLRDALAAGEDVGRYGRLVFAVVGRHFMDEEQLVELLANDPSMDETQARGLVDQVKSANYSPPKPAKIGEWQAQQDFPICPANDPDACNVYRNLTFPDGVYDKIGQYHVEKANA